MNYLNAFVYVGVYMLVVCPINDVYSQAHAPISSIRGRFTLHGNTATSHKRSTEKPCTVCPRHGRCVPKIQCPAHIRPGAFNPECHLNVGAIGICCFTGSGHAAESDHKRRSSSSIAVQDMKAAHHQSRLRMADLKTKETKLMENPYHIIVNITSPSHFHHLMKRTRTGNEKIFYVVHFIESPFVDTDKYVCVPYSWIILQRATDRMVVVAYPNNEDPSITRDRVKKSEIYNDEWRYYTALIKYESDTYEDAEYWIVTKHDYESSDDDVSEVKDTPIEHLKPVKPQLTVKPYQIPRKSLPRISICRPVHPVHPKPKENQDKQLLKSDLVAKPTSVINYASIAPGCKKQNQSMTKNEIPNITPVFNNETSTEQTESIQPALSKITESVDTPIPSTLNKLPCEKQPRSVSEHCQLPLIVPIIELDNDKSIDKSHDHLLQLLRGQGDDEQSKKPYDIENSQLFRLLNDSTIVPKPNKKPNQNIHQYQQTQLPLWAVSDVSNSNFQPRGTDNRSSTEVSHNFCKPPYQSVIDSIPTYSNNVRNSVELSSQQFKPTLRKQSSLKRIRGNPVNKKTRLEQTVTYTSISTVQPSSSLPTQPSSFTVQTQPSPPNYLQVSREPMNIVRSNVKGKYYNKIQLLQSKNASAAQNLSNLAHQSRSIPEQSYERKTSSSQLIQQVVQDMFNVSNTTNVGQRIDHGNYLQRVMMNGGYVTQNEPNPTNQSSPFHQYPRQLNYTPQLPTYEQLYGLTGSTHSNHRNSVVNAQNSSDVSNRSHQNIENSQKIQDPPNYYNLNLSTARIQTGLLPHSKSNSQKSWPQKVTDRSRTIAIPNTSSRSLPNPQSSLLQDTPKQKRLDQSHTEHHNMNLAFLENILTNQNSSDPTRSSSDRSYETQSTLVHGNRINDLPPKNNVVVEATEMYTTVDVDHYENASKSVVVNSFQRLVNETDEYFAKIEKTPYQVVASDSEVILLNDLSTDVSVVDISKDNSSGGSILPDSDIMEKSATSENAKPGNQLMQPRVGAEQLMQKMSNLFIRIGENLSFTRDIFTNLQNSVTACADEYQKLLEKVEFPLTSTSSPNNVTSEPEERLAVKHPGKRKENNNTSSSEASKSCSEEKSRFTLPPDYDPNDSKWTLRYRKKKPGLIELMPESGIYVKKKALKHIEKEATDCRALARMLLSEVFSKSALCVCSITGAKARAFKNMNISVRPGLDEHARMTMLAYIEEHGSKRRWKTNTTAIMSSIRTRLQDIKRKNN